MTTSDRQVRQVFVELTDTLVDDFDIVDFLDRLATRCTELLGVSACGLLLVDHHGTLNLVAASTEQARLLELFQLQNREGPCLETYRSGRPIQSPRLDRVEDRWPRFAPAATRAGYRGVHALPMRLRDEVIGAMNLFSVEGGELSTDTLEFGQALADAATIGILHQRAVYRSEVIAEQLQRALDSRVLIEQAKGFLAGRLDVSVDEAFAALRSYARSHNRRIGEVAREVIEGTLTISVPQV